MIINLQKQGMRKNKQLVSFLDFDSSPTFSFSKVKVIRLIDEIRHHSQRMLTNQFVKKHQKQLKTPLFEFAVEDSYKKWKQDIGYRIVKKFQDFVELRQQLRIKYLDKLLPIPVENVDEMDESELYRLLEFFQHFLNVLGKEKCAAEEAFYEFVGAMVGSELKEMKVYYQGILGKRAGGRHNQSSFKKIINMMTAWNDRLVSITSQGIYLCQPDCLDVEDTLMFSSTFSFLYGEAATGYPYGIVINSSQRILNLDAHNIFNLVLVVRFLSQALNDSEITSDHRFASFAPVRLACDAKYYIDGEYYFQDLCEALLSAKKEVFITGWMISPYFSLKRPDPKGDCRIDNILSYVANAGIKVSIIIYNGPKMALNIDSEFTKTYLTKLSNNIKVILHPNYVLIPFLWSHHQKMVVIDQKIAFMGGLDIGYGRFDTRQHLLSNPKDSEIWTGVDFCNYRVSDILKPQDYESCSIECKTTPRMPWHDIGVRLVGGSVQDLSRHFIQYWNYVNFQMDMNDRELLMYVGMSDEDLNNAEQDQKSQKLITRAMIDNRRSVRLSSTLDAEEEGNFPFLNFFNQKENVLKRQSEVVELPFELEVEDKEYHTSQFTCESEIQNDKEKEFYLQHMQEVSKFQTLISRFNPKNLISHRLGTSFEEVTLAESLNYELKPEKKKVQKHQILRSAAMWSLGLEYDKPEHSIGNAYLDLIENAKEFIYIENQFFISERNGVAEAIALRIIRAHENKQKFRVVILIPALPGFDGHPADEKSAVFRVQVNLILKTVNKMYEMLYDALESNSVLREYIYVFSLRTHGWIEKTPVTQIIYIHSKIMIVDDRIALIGSANINDRSLKGPRDTELAVVIEDEDTKEIQIGEGKRVVSVFAHHLRKELYMQHFSLTSKQAEDYHDSDTWSLMIQTSKKNHQIYRLLFGCYPDNKMSTFSQMQIILKESDSAQFDILKLGIKSNAIPYQRYFLRNQNLSLGPSQKEYFVPQINFT